MNKLFLIILSSFVLAGCNRIDNHQPLSSHRLSFAKVNTIGQQFVSRRDNLNMVNICIRNPSRILLPLQFSLANSEGEVVRTLNFDAGNIDNSDCTRFQFEPIAQSKDQSYVANIAVLPDLDPESKVVELSKAALYIEGHGGGDYLGGNAYSDKVETAYDLHFKTLYKQDLRSIFAESWRGLFSRLAQDPFFDIIFVLLIIWMIKKYKVAR